MDYTPLLDKIMGLDKNIRFSLICDMHGNVVNTRHREKLENYLTENETKDALQYSVESWRVRNHHSKKIGKGKFAFVEYEKLRRITMPLNEDRMLLVTVDKDGENYEIIDRILNQIRHPENLKTSLKQENSSLDVLLPK